MKKIFNCVILSILIILVVFPSSALTSIDKPTPDFSNLSINSDYILLVEKETGDILYEKNAYTRMYPASTTKILTAIIVIENAYLNELVTVSPSALSAVPPSYTVAGLETGEDFRVEDLLYVLLVPSANDAANVLAEHISGSIPAFAELMNKKANSIGLTDSNFTNPSGVHDSNLYTTAHDLSLLARYAMNNEKFREIVQTPSYTLPGTALHPEEDRTFTNSNLLLNKSEINYYYEYTTGIKTGFTDQAGDCLVASAKKNNVEFIVVCLKSNHIENGLRNKFLDSKTLFDFAFDNYTTYYQNLQDKNENNGESFVDILFSPEEKSSDNIANISQTYSQPIKILTKIIAIFIIILAFVILFFRKRTPKKKKRRR